MQSAFLAVGTCCWLVLSLACALTPGSSLAAASQPALLHGSPSAPNTDVCMSPCWASWGFPSPSPSLSWNLRIKALVQHIHLPPPGLALFADCWGCTLPLRGCSMKVRPGISPVLTHGLLCPLLADSWLLSRWLLPSVQAVSAHTYSGCPACVSSAHPFCEAVRSIVNDLPW